MASFLVWVVVGAAVKLLFFLTGAFVQMCPFVSAK